MISSAPAGGIATPDGIIRNAQADKAALPGGPWDGTRYSYIPGAELALDPSVALHDGFDTDLDPITYQVLRSRFWHMNLEHGDILKRVSGSFVIVAANDFAVSLLTENGDIVTVGPSIQYFTGISDLIVKWTLENRGASGIHDGDVFLQNDPFIGTAQQSDVTVYAPVYWEGEIFSWVFSCAHVGDLGGVDPGGWSVNARDIYDEAVVFPPVKIATSDGFQADVVQAFARQSRDSGMIVLNAKAQLAGIEATRRQMLELIERYGPKTVKGAMRRMIADCSQVVSKRLQRIPDGTWTERLYVCGTDTSRTAHAEVVTFTKRGDRLTCGNAGTDPQGGHGNATYAIFRSNAVAAVAAIVAYDQLGCMAGVANHIVFEPVPGTRNVARHPAACSSVMSATMGANLAYLAASKMALSGPPDIREHASGSGGMAVPIGDIVFGMDADGNFLNMDAGANGAGMILGCIGGSPYRDGIDGGGSWYLVETTAGNVEEGESSGVALILARRETVDSGGPGRWRGGNGGTAMYAAHKAHTTISQMSSIDPGVNTAAGLGGGYFGLASNHLLLDDGRLAPILAGGLIPRDRAELEEWAGPLTRLHPRATVAPLEKGDCIVVDYNGGGGYGDPLRREPERVVQDVRDGRISAQGATLNWGVVLDAAGDVDAPATERRRDEIRAARLADAERFAGHEPLERRPGAIVLVVEAGGGGVDLVEIDGEWEWACTACAEPLGPADGNFKLASAHIDRVPSDVDPHRYADPREFSDPDIVLRRYVCPACSTLLSQEYCRAADEPLFDFKIDRPRDV